MTREATILLRGSVGTSCSVTERCREVATAQVGCLCKTLHYGVNACEAHIATAARRVYQNGCEVEVCRIYTNGTDQKLYEGRRDQRRKEEKHQEFLGELLEVLAEHKSPPTTDEHPDPTDHLKAVVRYAYADLLRDRIERFRNSLNKS